MWVLLLLLEISHAEDDIHAIEDGQIIEITGPAVWMTEPRFRRYVADGRKLVSCVESLDKAIDEGLAANERAIEARDIAMAEFRRDEELVVSLVRDNAKLGAELDQERLSNSRIRQQRNIAWAISGGFLAASVAATTIALSH